MYKYFGSLIGLVGIGLIVISTSWVVGVGIFLFGWSLNIQNSDKS